MCAQCTAAQFTAPDLSTIARNLDMLEATYHHDNRERESMNMDDTGSCMHIIQAAWLDRCVLGS